MTLTICLSTGTTVAFWKSAPRASFLLICFLSNISSSLIDGVNVTMSDEHMWLAPFTDGGDHLVTVDLGRASSISGLRVWNYNKSPDDTHRGVR